LGAAVNSQFLPLDARHQRSPRKWLEGIPQNEIALDVGEESVRDADYTTTWIPYAAETGSVFGQVLARTGELPFNSKVSMMTDDRLVTAAQLAFAVRLKDSTDVSDNTKNAQAIAKAWRAAVHDLDPDRFQIEAMVAPELDQKLDIVDNETACAYEFK